MGGGLQRLVGHSLLDGGPDLVQDAGRHAAVLKGHSHAAGARVEERVQQVVGHTPAQALGLVAPREVQWLLGPQRPVELRLEGVQDEVHLVQEQRTALHQLQDGAAQLGLLQQVLGTCVLLLLPLLLLLLLLLLFLTAVAAKPEEGAAACPVLHAVQRVLDLGKFQHKRLDGGGVADHHSACLPGLEQLVQQLPRDGGLALKHKGVHRLGDEGGEALTHHGAGHLQQRGGHNLGYQGLAVPCQQRQQGSDHCGLTRPHDELVHHGLARLVGTHELLDQVDLRPPEQNI
mmetsp:Transcript_2634/g.5810  ORF Transcript_2634/g.5810 Transcript_2634/m.5810 type:complete len:288 (-) Transcript_2634:1015-1878(-)